MEFKALFENFAQAGKVQQIMIRPARRVPVHEVSEVVAIVDRGLKGDRYNSKGTRQVTLIQEEHLSAAASMLGRQRLDASLIRRNIVVKGINLLALKDKRFRIGEAILEYSGQCHPCSRMEESLGIGGYNAMRGHGGITAKVIQSGIIKVNDIVSVVPNAQLSL